MKELIDYEYSSGRTTTMSDSELLILYRAAKEMCEDAPIE